MAEQRGVSEQLEALFRAATNHAILVTDLDGVLSMFNEGAQRLLGYSGSDVIGHHTPDLFFEPGELAGAAQELGVTQRYADVVSAAVCGAPWTRDWVWLTAAGEPLVVRLTVTEVLDAQGATQAYLGIATDVTAEVQATAELKAAELRWRTLLDVLPGTAVLVVDDEMRFLTAVGAGLASDTSITAGARSLLGKTLYEVLASPDAHEIEKMARSALAGQQRSEETRLSTGRTYSLVAMPLSNRKSRPEALIIAQDVTIDRERENSMRSAEERFRRLFDEAPNGAALVDLSARFRQVNPTMCRLLGRGYEELVGQKAAMIAATTDDEGEIERYFNDLLSAPEGRLSTDWTARRGDGQLVYLSASGVVLLDDKGQAESILINLLDISQRRKTELRLAHLAHHDPLTGLANRRRFDQELTAHLDRCRRYGATGALMVLDLDHFKQVNDTLGHAAGDQLIVATADALRNRLRTSDVVARMGGDEFAVLLPNVDRIAAVGVAESVVRLIRDEVKVFDADVARAVTTSIGVVLIDKPDVTAAELLAAADLTMYEAKEAGRDRYAMSEAGGKTPRPVVTTPSWADRIAIALSEQRLLLHAQPIINMRTQRFEGAEVLVRMLYGDNELLLPERFLYVAERVGLMPSIDTWVFSQAIDWLRRMRTSAPNFQLHVNIAAVSMGDEDLLETLQSRISSSGVDPSRLVFEVTETAAASHLEAARTFTETVKEIGCQLALDDFGAGFGSFYYLKHLHFDAVKVSGELVTKSVVNKTDRLILNSVLDLARGLGKRTIAEAVEDSSMLEAVANQGIDFAQGYHLGTPQSVDDILAPMIG